LQSGAHFQLLWGDPVWLNLLRQHLPKLDDATMLFIAAVGLGPFAGVLALSLHTLGTLSNFPLENEVTVL